MCFLEKNKIYNSTCLRFCEASILLTQYNEYIMHRQQIRQEEVASSWLSLLNGCNIARENIKSPHKPLIHQPSVWERRDCQTIYPTSLTDPVIRQSDLQTSQISHFLLMRPGTAAALMLDDSGPKVE